MNNGIHKYSMCVHIWRKMIYPSIDIQSQAVRTVSLDRKLWLAFNDFYFPTNTFWLRSVIHCEYR